MTWADAVPRWGRELHACTVSTLQTAQRPWPVCLINLGGRVRVLLGAAGRLDGGNQSTSTARTEASELERVRMLCEVKATAVAR